MTLIGLLAGGCGSAETSPPSSDLSGPAIRIDNSTLSHFDEQGRLLWAVDAAIVEYDRGADESRADDVRVRFLNPSGADSPQTASLSVRAERMTFENGTRHLYLIGNVQGDGPDGLTFATERAQWDPERRTVTGDRAVRIQREDLSMRGTGFSYDLRSERLSLQSASLEIQLDNAP